MKGEVVSVPLPEGFGKRMNDSQKSLAFMLVVGLGIDAAALEAEAERIIEHEPDTDRLVAIYRAAEKLARMEPP